MKLTISKYKKLAKSAEKFLFPINIGSLNLFVEVDRNAFEEKLKEWTAKDIGEIECGWHHNDPETKCLVHYDGWSLS